jgi:hypothetical protein
MYVLLPIYEIQDLKYNALYFNYTFNGYVYWKPVYMSLQTRNLYLNLLSIKNNNNTCGFIYISLSCDYLIWICHQNPGMHEMFISLSPSDNRLHVNRFSIHIPIEGIIEVECFYTQQIQIEITCLQWRFGYSCYVTGYASPII